MRRTALTSDPYKPTLLLTLCMTRHTRVLSLCLEGSADMYLQTIWPQQGLHLLQQHVQKRSILYMFCMLLRHM